MSSGDHNTAPTGALSPQQQKLQSFFKGVLEAQSDAMRDAVQSSLSTSNDLVESLKDTDATARLIQDIKFKLEGKTKLMTADEEVLEVLKESKYDTRVAPSSLQPADTEIIVRKYYDDLINHFPKMITAALDIVFEDLLSRRQYEARKKVYTKEMLIRKTTTVVENAFKAEMSTLLRNFTEFALEIHRAMDTNHDGIVTKEEFIKEFYTVTNARWLQSTALSVVLDTLQREMIDQIQLNQSPMLSFVSPGGSGVGGGDVPPSLHLETPPAEPTPQETMIRLMKEFKQKKVSSGDKVYSIDPIFAKTLGAELQCTEFNPQYNYHTAKSIPDRDAGGKLVFLNDVYDMRAGVLEPKYDCTSSYYGVFVPYEVWQLLVQEYGNADTKELALYYYHENHGHLAIEYKPVTIKVSQVAGTATPTIEVKLFRHQTFQDLIHAALLDPSVTPATKELMKSKPLYVMLMTKTMTNSYHVTNISDGYVDNMADHIGTKCDAIHVFTAEIRIKDKKNTPFVRGRCGLTNLGNTCYMASALQCLSNTPEVRRFFMSKKRLLADLNTESKLGTGGKLATEFAALLASMWGGMQSFVSPSGLRKEINTHLSQFAGYAQHDCQEFLSQFLDKLHEDINRVKSKPYIEKQDDEQLAKLSESERADITWNAHVQRESSVITDLFTAQYKSIVECPDCQGISLTFDPTTSMSLPIEKESIAMRTLPATYVPFGKLNETKKFKIKVAENGAVRDAATVVASKVGAKPQSICAGDGWSGSVYGWLPNWHPLEANQHVDHWFFECPLLAPDEARTKDNIKQFVKVGVKTTLAGAPTKTPLAIIVPKTITNAKLYEHVASLYGNLIAAPKVVEATSELDTIDGDDTPGAKRIKVSSLSYPFRLFVGLSYNALQLSVNESTGLDHLKCGIDDGETPVVLEARFSGVEPELSAVMMRENVITDEERSLSESQGGASSQGGDSSSQNNGTGNNSGVRSLTQCFKDFCSREQLNIQNTWYCPKCKDHKQAFKEWSLWRVPPILIIHLKRFQFFGSGKKLDFFVDCPKEGLDLTPVLAPGRLEVVGSPIYDLYAVANHSGSLAYGHYTATCKAPDGRWYEFNDSSVYPCNGDPVTSSAYVLMYRRRMPAGSEANAEESESEGEDTTATTVGTAAEDTTGSSLATTAVVGSDSQTSTTTYI